MVLRNLSYVVLCAAVCLLGQRSPNQGSADRMVTEMPKTRDARFIFDAAKANYVAVEYSALARERASTEAVRAYAAKIVDQRTPLGGSLRDFALNYRVGGASLPDEKAEEEYRRLQGLDAASFDVEYIRDMVKLAQREVALYQREAENGADPALKKWASDQARLFDQNLRAAEEIDRSFTGADISSRANNTR